MIIIDSGSSCGCSRTGAYSTIRRWGRRRFTIFLSDCIDLHFIKKKRRCHLLSTMQSAKLLSCRLFDAFTVNGSCKSVRSFFYFYNLGEKIPLITFTFFQATMSLPNLTAIKTPPVNSVSLEWEYSNENYCGTTFRTLTFSRTIDKLSVNIPLNDGSAMYISTKWWCIPFNKTWRCVLTILKKVHVCLFLFSVWMFLTVFWKVI